ncbi:endoplasmic reticulum metallopeptidase 1 [Polyplosphaeria fusca]|uniref:Peptide hydrolase n=1 Tax=Polyplosphaeria fusca TaxID=682080 RepID=A0A9P4R006_9PLEO|nr:endoplasmic reticulum metallopeptidase 1 [Polyplosphaeria fusca]
MVRLRNPLAFTPLPVIIVVSATYIALFAALVSVHVTVPRYPSKTPAGINLTQAWADLDTITRQYHPYNSHANDHVREYLLSRIKAIVASKGLGSDRVDIIDDNVSNVTLSARNTTVYFEGTNIIVAVRGSDDKQPLYPQSSHGQAVVRAAKNGGVLVNAHYDSVSTGFGATDDGVGVVSVLQLLSYFTEARNWPKRTVVLLLNNGEEDFLNGAYAFMRHPISQVPHTFLNLEGAGAGGRATLFRSTDTEVTKFYRKSPHPFGTVISSDGFKRRLIASQTDYVVFNDQLGLRGLDVAFMAPRARYHTQEDITRETSMNSLWHMLSAAIATVSGLAADTSNDFSGSGKSSPDGKVDAGTGTDAVWFDMFGKAFVIFRLHTLFALNVTLLAVAPIALIALVVALSRSDKMYLFARKKYVHGPDDDQAVQLNGWRGFFRFPITFVVSTAACIGLAYLVQKTNPYIIYSSPWAVWSMMLSAWTSIAWFLLRGASAMRPSALQRIYVLIWLFVGGFALLVFTTILAQRDQIAGGYFSMYYFAAIFVALLISFFELFFLPRKSVYVSRFDTEGGTRRNSEAPSRPLTGTTGGARSDDRPILDDDATETTSLLRGDRRSFARYGGRRQSASEATEQDQPSSGPPDFGTPFPGEQEWSGKLPSWLWILQFLLLAPIVVILVGQIALILTTALHQTPADGGSPPLYIYLVMAIFTALLVAPTGPFLHRFTHHIPAFLFFILAGTVIYNLVAFPFSRSNRLKMYFLQEVDCDTGANTVSLTSLDEYVRSVVRDIPSAKGTNFNCSRSESRREMLRCGWEGLPAKVVPTLAATFSNHTHAKSWIAYNVTRAKDGNEATIRVVGRNTRACRILFDKAITDLAVHGAVSDPRFNATGSTGSREVRLWHRDWSQPWNVSVKWDSGTRDANSTLSGRIVCLWSDANAGDIPAFDEVQHYMPLWAVTSKMGDGLVEGSKRFKI